MHNSSAGRFTKEKLLFLCGSAVVAAALFLFAISGPAHLEPVPSIAYGQRMPAPLNSPALAEREAEDFYVVDGKISKQTDTRTGLPVNRERRSPFEPFASLMATSQGVKGVVKDPNTGPKAPIDFGKKDDDKKSAFEKVFKTAEVEFVGVMTTSDGESYGLLKPNDGSPIVRVKKDSILTAGGEKYIVTGLEKQAIRVVDGRNTPYLLKDSMFESVVNPDSTKTPKVQSPQPQNINKVKQLQLPRIYPALIGG